jgi:hypothetical protein
MRRGLLPIGVLSLSCWAVAQEPPAPPPAAETPESAPPSPPPAPAPPAPAPPPPPPLELPAPAAIGIVTEPAPVLRIAELEAGGEITADNPRIAESARLLDRVSAVFIEDAPRIAELTAGACRAIRAGNGASSPFEILEGALLWRRPPGTWGSVPRRFEVFAAQYRKLRTVGGRDHAQALAALGAVAPKDNPGRP